MRHDHSGADRSGSTASIPLTPQATHEAGHAHINSGTSETTSSVAIIHAADHISL
jgi:hypothetical protein